MSENNRLVEMLKMYNQKAKVQSADEESSSKSAAQSADEESADGEESNGPTEDGTEHDEEVSVIESGVVPVRQMEEIAEPAKKGATRERSGSGGRGQSLRSTRGGTGQVVKRRRVIRGAQLGITGPAIKRLARRAGVKRIERELYDWTRAEIARFLNCIETDAATYMFHAKRRTISSMDVIHSLEHNERPIYGCVMRRRN